jgi:hypothetical protein
MNGMETFWLVLALVLLVVLGELLLLLRTAKKLARPLPVTPVKAGGAGGRTMTGIIWLSRIVRVERIFRCPLTVRHGPDKAYPPHPT